MGNNRKGRGIKSRPIQRSWGDGRCSKRGDKSVRADISNEIDTVLGRLRLGRGEEDEKEEEVGEMTSYIFGC